MPEFKKIATVDEIPSGQGRIFEVNGNQIAVWNLNGNFYAFQNVCPHRGGPVGEGEIEGNTITCPWHGWRFDITSGINPFNPAAKLSCYAVKVDNNEVHVSV